MKPGGYAWWYIDALSDDGKFGLTIIVFVGSVFSPYYALARRRGVADPNDHCAFNIALYGERGARWAMTERGRTRLSRDDSSIGIGPSAIRRDGDAFILTIDETCAPIPKRLRGRICISFDRMEAIEHALDAEGLHRWRPLAPQARIEVNLENPALTWSGSAYVDSNWGDEPLEDGFVSWHWSRAHTHEGAAILYDALRRDGESTSLSLLYDRNGCRAFDPPPEVALSNTMWRLERMTRSDPGFAPVVLQEFENSPFYSRSLLKTRLRGEEVHSVHESLSLDRFVATSTQLMLPFRMPRWR